MPGPRVSRELAEMVQRLEAQLDLLDNFARAAFGEKNEVFLPEVATKLRVLLVRSRHNKPLLLEVADRLGVTLEVTLDGPPGVRSSPESASPQAGDVMSLDSFFDLQAVTIRTSKGLVSMTKRELIRAWAEQLGGAHEDWSVDEALLNAVKAELPLLGIRPTIMELANCTRTALRYGRHVVQHGKRDTTAEEPR
jgi:hypothetical protein